MTDSPAQTEQFLYLTTTGWRSGRPHRIEIWFVELDGHYYLCSELRERAHWVRNLEHEPNVSVELAGRAFAARARVVTTEAEPELASRVSARFDERFGWSDGLLVELAPV